jgi:hypothetical protein
MTGFSHRSSQFVTERLFVFLLVMLTYQIESDGKVAQMTLRPYNSKSFTNVNGDLVPAQPRPEWAFEFERGFSSIGKKRD